MTAVEFKAALYARTGSTTTAFSHRAICPCRFTGPSLWSTGRTSPCPLPSSSRSWWTPGPTATGDARHGLIQAMFVLERHCSNMRMCLQIHFLTILRLIFGRLSELAQPLFYSSSRVRSPVLEHGHVQAHGSQQSRCEWHNSENIRPAVFPYR